MDTFFANPARADLQTLGVEKQLIDRNPFMTGLLETMNGLLAVLDEHRQVLALNDPFLAMLGIKNAEDMLGLRLGEALGCVHARDMPAGCGTTEYCPSCGAAVAMVISLSQNRPVERICALSAVRNGIPMELALQVRSHPMDIEGCRFLLLFVQDITRHQNQAALERTFFHDINNLVGVLLGASELMKEQHDSELADVILHTSLSLKQEIRIQKDLTQSSASEYQTLWQQVSSKQILEELITFFRSHTAARDRIIHFPEDLPLMTTRTDITLVRRVLSNMVINALEATEPQEPVRVTMESGGDKMIWCVWNRQFIPDSLARRIFQRNYSTKTGDGRGLGTFSMKLFGEKILGGQVTFTTDEDSGTTFRFTLP